MMYPFVASWVTGDKRQHHLLARPRNAPTRTGTGVAGLVFYGVLWTAGGSDVIALHFSLSNESLILALQLALILGPIAAFTLTKRICIGLQRKDREIALHGYETGRVLRLPGGEYIEVHEQLSAYERWKLIDDETHEPITVRPDQRGRIRWRDQARARLSRWFIEERIVPATTIDAEHHHAMQRAFDGA